MKLPIICNKLYFLLGLLALVMCVAPVSAQETPASDGGMFITADLVFPKTTCAYVSVRDIAVLRSSWQKTSLGELQNSPEMKEFFQSLQQQLSGRLEALQTRLGVTLDDIGEISSSEIAAALVQLDAKRYGVAVMINVGDKLYETQSMLSKIAERVTKSGGTHQKQQMDDAEIYILNIPNPETEKMHRTYYVLKGNLLIASDRPEIIKDVWGNLNAIKRNPDAMPESFSSVDAYLDILRSTVMGDTLPDIIWYVDPIRLLQVQRLMQIENDPSFARSKDTAALLSNAGFDGIEAIGGVMTFNHLGYDATQRVFVSIPNAPQGSLKMLSFDENADRDIPEWISEKVGAVHVVNLNFLDVFDNLGPLVNQFFGEGSDTVWDDVLDGFENDPYGPQLDLREEVFALLENKVIIMAQNLKPKEIDGERTLIAVPVRNATQLRENLGALLDEEPTFEVLENGDDIRWKLIDEEQEGGSAGAEVKGKRFPEMTLTVWNDYLLIASQPDFIDYIQTQTDGVALSDLPIYKKIQNEAATLAGTNPQVTFHFVNSAVLREHTYEMVKNGMLAESAATYSSILGELLRAETKNKDGQFIIDTSNLPEYEQVREYFMPTGGCVTNVEGGILYQGFWMSQEKMGKSASKVLSTPDADAPIVEDVKAVEDVDAVEAKELTPKKTSPKKKSTKTKKPLML